MNINSFTLKYHFSHSTAAEHLFNLAKDIGFEKIKDKDDEQKYQERTINALKVAGVEHLSDLDAFISRNLEKIQTYLNDLHRHRFGAWSASNYFLYELIILLKYPVIFTKEYQEEHGWSDAVAKNVERALKIHSPEMTR